MLILLSYEGNPEELLDINLNDFKTIHALIMEWIAWRDAASECELMGIGITDWLTRRGIQSKLWDYQQVSGNDGYVY